MKIFPYQKALQSLGKWKKYLAMIFKEQRQIMGEILLCPCLGIFFHYFDSIIINHCFLPVV